MCACGEGVRGGGPVLSTCLLCLRVCLGHVNHAACAVSAGGSCVSPWGPPSAPTAPAWICTAASADRWLRLCDDKGILRWPALPWPPPSQAHPVPGLRRFCKRDPDGPSPLCGPARMLRRSCGKEVRPEDGLCSILLSAGLGVNCFTSLSLSVPIPKMDNSASIRWLLW